MLGERNFSACCIIIFGAYAVLYGNSTLLPGLLQSLFGYNALQSGLVMSPAGFFALLTMPIVARVLGRQTDARWVIMVGLLVMAAGNYWMSQLNLDISPGQVVWPRVAVIVGLAICFAPANVAAYLYTPMELRGAAVGLLSLLRNEGGSVGTSLSQASQDHREQFHTLRLGEYLDPFNPAVHSFTEQSKAFLLQQTGDPALSQELAWQAGKSTPAAGVVSSLFRLLLDFCHGDACAGASRLLDEALRGRERRAHWRRINSGRPQSYHEFGLMPGVQRKQFAAILAPFRLKPLKRIAMAHVAVFDFLGRVPLLSAIGIRNRLLACPGRVGPCQSAKVRFSISSPESRYSASGPEPSVRFAPI